MSEPVLSIGLIFKNEIRCLERCLQSLEPLRQAVPCEVVMADTGSEDGSRAVAEKYADIIIDFPWVNDFSAARNAVMDRASGEWYLSIDADEWLDEDISELTDFLLGSRGKACSAADIVVRSYTTHELAGYYIDGLLNRLVRMSTGIRYQGAIHESWIPPRDQKLVKADLKHTILHHDGYVGLRDEAGKPKRERNRAILQAELTKKPEDLRLLMSYIDCSRGEADAAEYIRRAAALVEEKKASWQQFGPPIFRYAVFHAHENHLPELWDWIDRAAEWFPDSFFTTVDVAYAAFIECWARGDYSGSRRWGDMFTNAFEDMTAGRGDQNGLLYGTLLMGAPRWAVGVRILTASANLKEGDPERARKLLEDLDGAQLEPAHAGNLAVVLREFHSVTDWDTAPLLERLYGELCRPEPSPEQAEERRTAFLQMASVAFDPAQQERERQNEQFRRLSYTAFLPLADRCEIGLAAAVLESGSAEEAAALLAKVEKWEEFPALALSNALERGVRFPLPERPMKLEELDDLAQRLSQQDQRLELELALSPSEEDLYSMTWAWSLALAAVRTYDWAAEDADAEQGMELARTFARVEWDFLHRFYMPSVLCEENIGLLPSLHRFGWYCGQAFNILETGDAAGYVRLLRAGLALCEGMKDMAGFLVEHTGEVQAAMAPPPELVELANQVRAIMARYDPNDPAVAALKQSEAYQKVAYLLERQ